MTSQAIANILKSAIELFQELLTQYSLNDELLGDLTTAFGSEYNSDVATNLITQWQTGNFDSFPEIEVRSSAEINGANGAYSDDTKKIYISEEYLLANTNDIKAITDLVLEEYGHFVDATINTVDAAGDEGAIFSGLVQGESFTEGELQQLQLENDQAVITLDGEEIAHREADLFEIEQQTFISINSFSSKLSKDFALRSDHTNVHIGDFNGDGKDDFLRQEKNGFDNDNRNTARIFFSNSSGSPNGTFDSNNRLTLPEDLGIKGDETNLYIGDFDGDGKDDILRQKKGNNNVDTARIYFSNGGKMVLLN